MISVWEESLIWCIYSTIKIRTKFSHAVLIEFLHFWLHQQIDFSLFTVQLTKLNTSWFRLSSQFDENTRKTIKRISYFQLQSTKIKIRTEVDICNSLSGHQNCTRNPVLKFTTNLLQCFTMNESGISDGPESVHWMSNCSLLPGQRAKQEVSTFWVSPWCSPPLPWVNGANQSNYGRKCWHFLFGPFW